VFCVRRGAIGGGTSGDDCTFFSLPSGAGRGGVGSEPGRVGGPRYGPRAAAVGRLGIGGGGGGGGDGRVAIDGDRGSTSAPAGGVFVVVHVRRTTGTGDRGDGVGVTDVSVFTATWSCC